MKTLKQNKVLAYLLAILTAFCAFIGVMLPNTANVALADTSDRITNATFPDTSTWEEKEATEFTAGKIYRFYMPAEQNSKEFYILFDENKSVGSPFIYYICDGVSPSTVQIMMWDEEVPPEDLDESVTQSAYRNHVEEDVVKYVDFITYNENFQPVFCNDKLREDGNIFEMGIVYELIDPNAEPEELPEENENGGIKLPDSSDIAEFIQKYTGLAVTGSMVTVVLLGAVAYFVFFRKRK